MMRNGLEDSEMLLAQVRAWTWLFSDGAAILPKLVLILAGAVWVAAFVRFLRRYIATRAALLAREREARKLAAVAEHARDVVMITDPEGLTIWVNRAFEQLTGYTRDEILGRKPSILQGSGTDPVTVKQISEALKARKPIKTEILNYTKSGRPYWIEIDIAPVFDEAGTLTDFIAVERDISGRVERETELRLHSEAVERARLLAEASDRAKSDFLANMSHEIRTPINGIMGFNQLLVRTTLDAQQREYVDIIESSSNYLLHLVNELLDMSKIESGVIDIVAKPFKLSELTSSTLEAMRPLANQKLLSLSFHSEIDEKTLAIGDRQHIRQILMNLIGNAIKFTDQGEVRLSLTREADSFVFAVEDTGCGIEAGKLNAIFDRFYQVTSKNGGKVAGAGLGLAIAKRLTELMAGQMSVTSIPGHGSIFTVRLPLPVASRSAPSSEQDVIGDKKGTLQASGFRILVADDHPANQKLILDILSTLGCETKLAENGMRALDAIEDDEFDLIIMDSEMPALNGIEATKRIRSRTDWKSRIPILSLTAHAMKGVEEIHLAAGADAYLSKPLGIEVLVDTVQSLARRGNELRLKACKN